MFQSISFPIPVILNDKWKNTYRGGMNLNLQVKEIEHPETPSSKAKPNI